MSQVDKQRDGQQHTSSPTDPSGLLEEVHRLRVENELLRARTALQDAVTGGERLSQVLADLTIAIERHWPTSICLILLIDPVTERLRVASAPRLPKAYRSALEGGLLIGDGCGPCGPCGTAAFLREPIVVADLAADPRWAAHAAPALACGLRSCWSTPFLSSAGEVLGTFAVYHHQPTSPTEADLDYVATAGRLASLAVERTRERNRRRRAERKVERTEERLSAVLASVDDHLVSFDRQWRYVFVNDAAASVLRMPKDDLLGQCIWELFPGSVGNQFYQELHLAAAEQRVVRSEHYYQLWDKWFENHIYPTGDGVTVFSADVTWRKRAEAAAQESETRFRSLYEANVVGVAFWNADGRVTDVNDAMLAMFGLSREEFDAGAFDWRRDTPPEYRGADDRAMAEMAQTGRFSAFEKEFVRRDGSRVAVLLGGALLPGQSDRGVSIAVDITARRRAEDEVREKAEALSGILAASVDHLYVVGGDGRYRYVSRGGARALGFEPSDVMGRHWKELGLPPEVMIPFDSHRDEALRTGLPLHREATFAGFGGEMRNYEYVISPLPSASGVADAVVAVSRDMTDRRHVERTLDRYRLLSKHTRDIIFFLRPDGEIVDANEAAVAAYGYDRQALLSMNIAELRAASTRMNVSMQLAEAAESGTRFETLHRRRDGSVFDVEVSSLGADVGGERLLLSVVRDITQRKAAESTLVRNEQVGRFLADAGAALAEVNDRDATLCRVASLAVPRFADWCTIDVFEDGGFRRVAMVHSDPSKVQLGLELHRRFPSTQETEAASGPWKIVRTGEPDLIPQITDAMIDAVEDPERRRMLHSLGLRSYLAVPLKVRDEILGVLTFVAAESGRLFDLRDLSLAEDLARRTAVALENVRLYDGLRDADRRKNEFLAMLGHELRNPLAPIRSGLDLLKIDGLGGEVVELMSGQVEHVVRLVDDLLDVSRILRGRVELRRGAVQFSEVVRRAEEIVRPMLAAQNHSFHVSIPEKPVWLEADLVRLTQVLTNLLNNASKYTEPGGSVSLEASVSGGELAVCISDTGVGIDPELLPRVFELFTQSTRSIDRSQGGLGIGLTIVKSLVEMHGGIVSARSNGPGCGSQFLVRLPVLNGLQPAVVKEEPRPTSAGLRILVVDDNVPAAKLLVRLLGKLGDHEVFTAHDGEGALAAAEAYHPDLILLDIGLPRPDGHEVCRRLRSKSEFSATLLVALTGYGTEDDRRRSAEAGFDEHVTKPPSIDSIRSILSHPKLLSSRGSH